MINWNVVCFAALAILLNCAGIAHAQNKGISFQATLKDPDGNLPNATGLTFTVQILDPVNNCVLREEEHSGVNVTNGYLNLVIGNSAASLPSSKNPNPILSLQQAIDNSKVINGFGCAYTPQVQHHRKIRLIGILPRVSGGYDTVQADFNMRSVAYAIDSESVNGKTSSDFVNTNNAKGVTQANAESIFERFAKLDALLNNTNASGNGISANISGNAATATTATNVSGTVAIANGGTGATSASGARTNLGLGSLATITPTGTADNTTYLRGDGTWAAAGGAGAVSSVAGRTGTVVITSSDLADFSTAADARITAQKGVNSGLASLNSSGKVPAAQLNLVDTDIPNLDTAKITTGTFADSFLAGLSIDKLISATGKYFNYKPNNVACADNEILKYDSTLNASAGGWKCAVQASAPVTTVAGRTGAVTLSNSDISGLGDLATKNAVALGTTEATGVLPISKGGTGVSTLTTNRLLGTTGGGAVSFVTCNQGEILGFDATGIYGCYDPGAYSIFKLGGNTVTATAVFGTKSNHNISFITNDTEKMVLQADGKLGIGRAPAYAVDVNGAVNATELRISGSLIGEGIQDPIRTVAVAGAGCAAVGTMAKSASGELLVCDEDTSVLSTTDCTANGVGSVTFSKDGEMYVCAE